MKLRFWGTRGSIPQAGYETLRHGGNTSCVHLRSAAGTCIVLDCGTGAHGLGRVMLRDGLAPKHGHLLITHTHWDHIQGFPFFAPLFDGSGSWDVYGPRGIGQSLKESLVGQLRYTFFPVNLEGPATHNRYHELVEGQFSIDEVRVTTRFLNHPALTLGYRLELDGVVVVYATDHEAHDRRNAGGISEPLAGEDLSHAQFVAGADLLIHDAQYTAAEYPDRIGWGHSTMEYVVDLAMNAAVRELALFHHDPWRTDDELDAVVAAARRRVAAAGGSLEVFAASEGRTIEMGRRPTAGPGPEPERSTALGKAASALVGHSVLLACRDEATIAILREALADGGYQLTITGDESDTMAAARGAPSLILLDHDFHPQPWDFCRQLRDAAGTGATTPPIVLLADEAGEEHRVEAEAAGVSDWLLRPFSPAYARSRIAAWLLRQRAGWLAAPKPPDEERRLASLRRLGILNTGPEERFDRLTRMAARLLNVPITALSLVDADRQWFKSVQGTSMTQGPREASFCAFAILSGAPLVVPDAFMDPRFADNPAVTGEPFVRFYAGVPVHAPDGMPVGSFCAIGQHPRELDEDEIRLLTDLARMVEAEFTRGSTGPLEDDRPQDDG